MYNIEQRIKAIRFDTKVPNPSQSSGICLLFVRSNFCPLQLTFPRFINEDHDALVLTAFMRV